MVKKNKKGLVLQESNLSKKDYFHTIYLGSAKMKKSRTRKGTRWKEKKRMDAELFL
jgi:hypothetical protein